MELEVPLVTKLQFGVEVFRCNDFDKLVEDKLRKICEHKFYKGSFVKSLKCVHKRSEFTLKKNGVVQTGIMATLNCFHAELFSYVPNVCIDSPIVNGKATGVVNGVRVNLMHLNKYNFKLGDKLPILLLARNYKTHSFFGMPIKKVPRENKLIFHVNYRTITAQFWETLNFYRELFKQTQMRFDTIESQHKISLTRKCRINKTMLLKIPNFTDTNATDFLTLLSQKKITCCYLDPEGVIIANNNVAEKILVADTWTPEMHTFLSRNFIVREVSEMQLLQIVMQTVVKGMQNILCVHDQFPDLTKPDKHLQQLFIDFFK